MNQSTERRPNNDDNNHRIRTIIANKLVKVAPPDLSVEDARSWSQELANAIIQHHNDSSDQQLAQARTLYFNLKRNGRRLLAQYTPNELAQMTSTELCQGTNVEIQRQRATLNGWDPPVPPNVILQHTTMTNTAKTTTTTTVIPGWMDTTNHHRRLVLVLNDQSTYNAYKDYFTGIPRIDVVQGDILQCTTETAGDNYYDALVSPANTMGNMDGGIDRVYAHFLGWSYGRPYDRPNPLQIAIDKTVGEDNGRLEIGQAILVRDPKKHLIAAPTMEIPSKIKTNSKIVRDATLAAFRVWKQHPDIQTIRMPAFGTGYGQVPPTVAAAQTLEAFVLAWKEPTSRSN